MIDDTSREALIAELKTTESGTSADYDSRESKVLAEDRERSERLLRDAGLLPNEIASVIYDQAVLDDSFIGRV